MIDLLSTQLGYMLYQHNLYVTTAESCTGGGIAQAITEVAGSSGWFSHGYVTYSNLAKHELLGVPMPLFDDHGAVSQPVVEAMTQGALAASKADIAVAVSGVAGPGGGSEAKPVGTVWITWQSTNKPPKSQQLLLEGDRRSIRNQSVIYALEGLIAMVKENTV